MESVGLIPSDTGKPEGKKTGQKMTHYIEEGGRYEKAFNRMPKKHLLTFTSLEGDIMKALIEGSPSAKGESGSSSRKSKLRPPSRKKTKYTCPSCKSNVWGKPSLNIQCLDCGDIFRQVV